MQADKAAEIREMFLEALDGINGKKRKNTESETKDSRKKVMFQETDIFFRTERQAVPTHMNRP